MKFRLLNAEIKKIFKTEKNHFLDSFKFFYIKIAMGNLRFYPFHILYLRVKLNFCFGA